MKKLLTALLLICAFSSSAQIQPQYKSYGYVGGVRLDSIDAKYALVEITSGMRMLAGNAIKRYTFTYGQKWRDEKEIRVVDNKGDVITFENTATALNFFDFNGWEVLHFYTDGTSAMILKKK